MLGCNFGVRVCLPQNLARMPLDNIKSRCAELNGCIVNTDYAYRLATWRYWCDGFYCRMLNDDLFKLRGEGITSLGVFSQITGMSSHQWGEHSLKNG